VKRLTLSGIIAGVLLIFLGIVTVGSAGSQSAQTETRAAGLLLMAAGAMVVAIPLYIDARRMQSQKKKQVAQTEARLRCFVCGSEVATMRCQKHMVRLCYDCIPQHDEGEQCYYVPLNRTRRARA
jgi:hypothetical protein